jgi:transposase
MPPCLIGMEACVSAHHLSRKLKALCHDARLMSAKYVRPYVPTKTAQQLDLQALHRVRERLVSQRAGGVPVRQGRKFLRAELPPSSPRAPMCALPACCTRSKTWPQLDDRIDKLSTEI